MCPKMGTSENAVLKNYKIQRLVLISLNIYADVTRRRTTPNANVTSNPTFPFTKNMEHKVGLRDVYFLRYLIY